MTPAILLSVVAALAAGLMTGFGRGWKESFIGSSLAIPFLGSIAFAIRLEPPSFLWGWALLTLFWSFLAASIAWGVGAGVRHGLTAMHGKLVKRRRAS